LLAHGNATNPDQIRTALQETAEDLGTPGRDNIYSYGLINAFAALNWNATPACLVDADCDDGLYCNGAETCLAGVCKAGTTVECAVLNDQCNTGICDEALDTCVVQPKPNDTSCDDGLYCNIGETCQIGVCGGGEARNCTDGESCTTDFCDESSDTCLNTWPACGLTDSCCGPECGSINDPDCAAATLCWSGNNGYLIRNTNQARKFCKCAQGTYGYKNYSYTFGRKTAYKYNDSGNNTNWLVSSTSSYNPITQVTCTDGVSYPTNKDYSFPK
jgi:hypothetical protein